MSKDTRPPSYPLRLPPELRSKLEEAAKEGHRPLSNEIILRLEQSFNLEVTTSYEERLNQIGMMFSTLKTARRLLEGAERIEGETDEALAKFISSREKEINEEFTSVVTKMREQKDK